MSPVSLPPSRYDFAIDVPADADDFVVGGGDLEPATVIEAYRHGFFPMGMGEGGGPPMGWWSPNPRGVLFAGDHHVSRSLRRARSRFEVTVDSAFDEVVAGCADPGRDGAWITPVIAAAYARLHELGWAHSVEVWNAAGDLVGGLYGIAIGGFFAGESMFHRETDASKVALWATADIVFGDRDEERLFDVQWQTPHLASQGVRQVSRTEYLDRLAHAVRAEAPVGWG